MGGVREGQILIAMASARIGYPQEETVPDGVTISVLHTDVCVGSANHRGTTRWHLRAGANLMLIV